MKKDAVVMFVLHFLLTHTLLVAVLFAEMAGLSYANDYDGDLLHAGRAPHHLAQATIGRFEPPIDDIFPPHDGIDSNVGLEVGTTEGQERGNSLDLIFRDPFPLSFETANFSDEAAAFADGNSGAFFDALSPWVPPLSAAAAAAAAANGETVNGDTRAPCPSPFSADARPQSLVAQPAPPLPPPPAEDTDSRVDAAPTASSSAAVVVHSSSGVISTSAASSSQSQKINRGKRRGKPKAGTDVPDVCDFDVAAPDDLDKMKVIVSSFLHKTPVLNPPMAEEMLISVWAELHTKSLGSPQLHEELSRHGIKLLTRGHIKATFNDVDRLRFIGRTPELRELHKKRTKREKNAGMISGMLKTAWSMQHIAMMETPLFKRGVKQPYVQAQDAKRNSFKALHQTMASIPTVTDPVEIQEVHKQVLRHLYVGFFFFMKEAVLRIHKDKHTPALRTRGYAPLAVGHPGASAGGAAASGRATTAAAAATTFAAAGSPTTRSRPTTAAATAAAPSTKRLRETHLHPDGQPAGVSAPSLASKRARTDAQA